LAGLGVNDFKPFQELPTTANKPVGTKKTTRREWRIKPTTGELRGVSIRETNKERKSVGWIDSRSPGWKDILASYERWQRTARYAVGTFEQRSAIHDKQPTGGDRGNGHDKQ
jgi:hypothetical protein